MTAASISDRIRTGIRKAGTKLSLSGEPLEGTIVRVSGADESVYPPTPGASTAHMFSGLQFAYTSDDMRGTDISARDVRVMVTRPVVSSAGVEIEPSNGDRLEISGVSYEIISVRSVGPGGFALYWVCQCRAS